MKRNKRVFEAGTKTHYIHHQTFDILIVALYNAKQREKTPENA
jgi:hypothetical protein